MGKRLGRVICAIAVGAMPVGLSVNCDLPAGVLTVEQVDNRPRDLFDFISNLFDDDRGDSITIDLNR